MVLKQFYRDNNIQTKLFGTTFHVIKWGNLQITTLCVCGEFRVSNTHSVA